MANLSPGQFPDHVPQGLALPGARQHRVFNTNLPPERSTEIGGAGVAGFKKVLGITGGQIESVGPYAPTEADFRDMGPARKEGRVNVKDVVVAKHAPTADDFADMGPARKEGRISLPAITHAQVMGGLIREGLEPRLPPRK